MKNIVYFDLETQKSIQQVGGYTKLHELKMSLGVTYSTADGQYRIFLEEEADALVNVLQRADLVVGHNVIGFDYRVLSAYTLLDLAAIVPTLDTLVELEKILGFRIKLDAIALGSLGVGKTADGMEALKWFQEGRWMEIAEYCCYDVKVSRLVHEYGCKNKKLYYMDKAGDQRKEVAVAWN